MLTGAVQPRPWRVLVPLAIAVLGVHALLLGGLDAGLGPANEAHPAVVQVREIAAPAVVSASPLPTTEAPVAAPSPAPAPRRRVSKAPPPTQAAARPVLEPVAAPEPPPAAASAPALEMPAEVPAPLALAASAPAPVDATAAAAASTENDAADVPPPTYPTRLPPSAALRYDLQRGRIGGSGEMRWSVDGDRYELRLDGAVVGIPVLTQFSQGVIDAAGIAPQRFTDQRVRRSAQAANFQREAGRVIFSGASNEVPLRAGAQDRLSWMVQLAAIAAADPARREAGAKTALQVIGARGDSSVWVFRCVGPDTVDTRAGPAEAVRYAREPRGPYDTGVEVWLDPARHFLPLRATMRNGADGEVLELSLRELTVGG